jgi:riboflavin biosynthesis pyrimidine reductase
MEHGFMTLPPHGAGGDDVLSLYRDAPRPPTPDRPWVLANFVAGLDGSIALDGRVGSLTSAVDQVVFRLLREVADVVMVGAGTVRAEGYGPVLLDDAAQERRVARGQQPVPPVAVVTRSLRLDLAGRLFTQSNARPLVITIERADAAARSMVEEVADVIVAGDTTVEPARALAALAERGLQVVTCEGGPSLITLLLGAGMLDELCLTVTPLVGGDPLRLVADAPQLPLLRFDLAHAVAGGRDELFLRYVSPRPEHDDA